MVRVVNTSTFINKAVVVHKNKYDYSMVEYILSTVKVKIICPIHGVFEQTPNGHLAGRGCFYCWNERLKKGIGHGRKPIKGHKEKKCPKCGIIYHRNDQNFHKNKNVSDGLNIYCRSCISLIQKESKTKNLDSYKERSDKSNKNCKESGYYKRYYQKKRDSDIDFNIANNLRNRIWRVLKRDNIKKDGSLWDLTGCNISELKIWIESQFSDGMTWDNHSNHGWHIDHKIPCASFDLTDPEQQKICFHYTNLQPLWAHDNLVKKDRIIG